MYADVIIPLALPRTYTWAVPSELRQEIFPGLRVEVELGKQKRYAGLVRRVHTDTPAYPTKEILGILDARPLVFPWQLDFWDWIATYYMCTPGEVMAAALPAPFRLSSETVIVWNPGSEADLSVLDNDAYLVAEALEVRNELSLSEVQKLVDRSQVYPLIRELIEKNICFVRESLKETYAPKMETRIRLHPQYEDEDKLAALLNGWVRAPKQLELLLAYLHLLRTSGEVTRTALLQKSGTSDAVLRGLIEKQILLQEKKPTGRLPDLPREILIDFTLSEAQEKALEELRRGLSTHQVCLLHGITSSGKTLLYIRQIEAAIREGKQVLYLLPEIALTAQVIRKLQKHFGGHIGIYHSKFNQNERVEIWNKVRSGELAVILGARSALFLPFARLGLIIVDEEHDGSYKQQEPAPRYHARDASIYLAHMLGARVLLGSATPSLESYYHAQTGKFAYAALQERYQGLPAPPIEIVDTRSVFRNRKDQLILTGRLQQAIAECLDAGKQVILFQNRRGYTPYQICAVCGWIPYCRDCDITLTFHKRTQKLHCHYCGQVYPQAITCLACGSDRFIHRSFGTEKIEERLEELFPEARVARMDLDSVRGKQAHDALIQQFEQGRIQILVGTQMVVKGLDFEHVQLVGVLDADSLLGFADYRVNERAFQLIEQVSGRAGRRGAPGRVLVQVAQTGHPLLAHLQAHDYAGFFRQEMEGRKKFFYPPFSRTILLTLRHRDQQVVREAADKLAENLASRYGNYMSGPAEPVVNRVRGKFLMEILFRLPKDSRTVSACKSFLLENINLLHAEIKFRSVAVLPDVDH